MSRNKIRFKQAFLRKYHSESYIYNHMEAYHGKEVKWKDLSKVFLLGLVKYLKRNVSNNSARLYCAKLRSLLNDYSDEINLPTGEFNKLLKIRLEDSHHVFLTNAEIMAIMDYKPESEVESAVQNQFLLSAFTGMRHSDVIRLTAKNVSGNTITYQAMKTKTVISIPSSPIVAQLLENPINRKVSDSSFNDAIRRICMKSGINDQAMTVIAGEERFGEKWNFITSHTARRSFATNMYLHMKDIYTVSKMMGHADVKTTEGYLCCDLSQGRAVTSYFDQFNPEPTDTELQASVGKLLAAAF